MARARNIKPGFFVDDRIGELESLARLLFIGMWTLADYRGCLEYRPKALKVQILPYDECDIELLVIALEKSGLIAIYTVGERRYIKVTNFERHQNPHKNERESGSEIPDIPKTYIKSVYLEKIEINLEQDGSARADSPFLIPPSLIPESLLLNPDSLNPIPEKKPTVANAPRSERETCFNQFWESYPAKVGRGDAIKAWKKIISPLETLELILQALSWQRDCAAWSKDDGQFIPNPSTYLNGKRWLDEPRKQSPPGTTEVGRHNAIAAELWLKSHEGNTYEAERQE